MIKRTGAMRHFATFYRPSDSLSDRGQVDGAPEIIASEVPVAIFPLGGRELELARQRVPMADLRVELRGGIPLTTDHYLTLSDGRRLAIGYVEDVDQDGRHTRLTCSVEVANG